MIALPSRTAGAASSVIFGILSAAARGKMKKAPVLINTCCIIAWFSLNLYISQARFLSVTPHLSGSKKAAKTAGLPQATNEKAITQRAHRLSSMEIGVSWHVLATTWHIWTQSIGIK